MPAPLNPHRARLANQLRALRAMTGMSGNRFADHIGWQQSRVSKLETGKQLPGDEDLEAWVKATGANAEQASELADLLAAARIEYATWRDVVRRASGGLAARQAEYRASEAEARHIAEYQPAMIPGIVQTAAYARELLLLPGGPTSAGASIADVEALVAERIRRQELLYQPDRLIQLVIGEAALHNAPGSIETMVGQLDRLIAVAGLSSVELGVIPFATRMPVMPISGFSIEDETVFVETLTGEQRLHEPNETTVYKQAFEELRNAASTGREAIALIRQVMLALEQR